jgi:hypothetical protein
MNFPARDFIKMQQKSSLLSVALLLVVAMFMTGIAHKWATEAQDEQQHLTVQDRELRVRLQRAPEEERSLRDSIALFQQLQANGIIGQEERSDWVEKIARIRAARRLFALQYEIAPRQPLSGIADESAYTFMASTMNLYMPLLHENDLLDFLADLQSAVHAHLLVRSCSIERAAQTHEHDSAAQLQAHCLIDWITVREKRA